MKKRIIGFIVILVLILTLLPLSAFAFDDTRGTCGENTVWSYDAATGTLTISGTGDMEDRLDKSVPWYEYRSSIKKAVIEDGVTSIGGSSFYACPTLTSISIPCSVTYIGAYAFEGCVSLKSVTIPSDVTYIGEAAFSGCTSLVSITIPKGVTTLGAYAFQRCANLTSIEMPNRLESIGYHTFSDCSSLKSIVIPYGVTSIGDWAFSNCSALVRIDMPKTVTKVGSYAFSGCGKIKYLYLPKDVSLNLKAFENVDVDYVYYGADETRKQYLFLSPGNESLHSASWVFNANGLPDHEYDDDYDSICNKCGEQRLALKDTSKIFTDIKLKDWYREYADYCVAYGIFTGTSATVFSPNDNITRAQFVQVLANISGVDTTNRNVTTEFLDVPAKKWFTPAVKWASKNGVVNGMGNGKFEPNTNVTREQMCVMLTNYAKFRGITLKKIEDKQNFSDDGKISKWAKSAVYTCQQADIVNGKGANTFDPKGTGTRAEACVIFTKFHKDYLAK